MQPPKDFLGEISWNTALSRQMAELPDDQEATRIRLITLRYLVAGDNQTTFAQQMGIEVKRWNNVERGLPLSKGIALTLVQKVPGLTLDWLFRGVENGLPVQLQRELTDAGNKATSIGRAG